MTKRRALSRLDRVKIFDRHGGVCLVCKIKIHAERGEKWEAMHVKSLWAGGTDTPDNMAPGHVGCHAVQTKTEAPVKARGDRQRANFLGIKKPRTIRAWRRFNGEIVVASRER